MKNKILKISVLVIMIIVSVFALSGCTETNNTENNVQASEKADETILVKDKWIKRVDDRDLYMIGTENEVLKIEDNWLKWNSADLYNKIEIGKKYKITTTGFRSTSFSTFRNINSAERVDE